MGRTTALFIDGYSYKPDLPAFLSFVREKTGADRVAVIIPGDFLHNGFPAEQDKYTRARELASAGADLVLELPVYSTWMTMDGTAFAAAAMIEKMRTVDVLALPTRAADPSFLQKLIMLLFTEPLRYQQVFKQNRADGDSIPQAQYKALESCEPGAGALLNDTVNAFAVEMGKALKRMYSSIEPVFLDLAAFGDAAADPAERETEGTAWDLKLGAMLKGMAAGGKPEETRKTMNLIFGGFDPYTVMIQSELKDPDGLCSFTGSSVKLATRKKTPEDMRAYFLRCLLGFQAVDNSICGMYTYNFCLRVLAVGAGAEAAVCELRERSWLPVFEEFSEEAAAENTARIEDESERMVVDFDRKAHELYKLIMDN